MGGTLDDNGSSIAVDKNGNVYTTGWFLGTADMDPGAATLNFNAVGGEDVFITKMDPSGNLLWAKQIGGANYDEAQSIGVDGLGNVYVTGTYQGTVDFDPGVGTFNITSVSPNANDIFIVKLNTNGNFIWAKGIGGSATDAVFSLALDASANIYTTGYFYNTVDFDPGASTANLTSIGANDIFISKLDSAGKYVFAKQFSGAVAESGSAITVDKDGNIYSTGYFSGTTDFDPGNGTVTLIANGGQDIYISKLDASGNFVWVKGFGGTLGDVGLSITTDAAGNVITTGYYQGTADFDPDAGITNLTSNGNTDIFILKLNSTGNLVWAKSIGGTFNDQANSIVADASGNIYTTGLFRATTDFDPGVGNYDLNAIGIYDMFISKLNANGDFVWANAIGGFNLDQGRCLKLDEIGNLYLTGSFDGVVDFDPGAGTSNLTGNGIGDICILKLGIYNTGIDNNLNPFGSNEKINIYPNPGNGIINLFIEKASNNERIEIYNDLGDIVYAQAVNANLNTIDLTKMANGLYLVQVLKDDETIATRKILKQ